ncbi:MAG: UbiX family flavin prenyltransferase [Planctomycetaceae bacterium]|nr:UbiX family flavin prenyltransferase [Planctomycetaceae bacterium]
MNPRFVVAITGASGAIYAVRLLEVLIAAGCDVHLSISPAGRLVLKQELNLTVDLEKFQLASLLPDLKQIMSDAKLRAMSARAGVSSDSSNVLAVSTKEPGKIIYHHFHNLMAPIASGSFLTEGMVVCPCSGGTLSSIAHGLSNNLIERACDVHLKERRRLIVVPRETPLSTIQLDNMKRCADAGVVVLPAMPGFYHGVKTIQDLVDFVVARICDQLGIEHCLMRRWGE